MTSGNVTFFVGLLAILGGYFITGMKRPNALLGVIVAFIVWVLIALFTGMLGVKL